MTKTEIERLEERVSKLNERQDPSLTTEDANTVRGFWIQLNQSPEEAQEYCTLDKRRGILYQSWLAGKSTEEEIDEWMKVSGRLTEIAHNIFMKRVTANDSLRDRIGLDLAPRVLRFQKLTEKPTRELSSDETKELETLLEWFSELRREALGETSKQ